MNNSQERKLLKERVNTLLIRLENLGDTEENDEKRKELVDQIKVMKELLKKDDLSRVRNIILTLVALKAFEDSIFKIFNEILSLISKIV